MTIIDATRSLIEFYTENEVYDLDENFLELVTISENEKVDKAIISRALEVLQEDGLVVPLKDPDKVSESTFAYVLKKPLVEYSQSVDLSFNTISNLTDVVNSFCDNLGIEKGKTNPLNVTEADVVNLLVIIETLKQQLSNEEEE